MFWESRDCMARKLGSPQGCPNSIPGNVRVILVGQSAPKEDLSQSSSVFPFQQRIRNHLCLLYHSSIVPWLFFRNLNFPVMLFQRQTARIPKSESSAPESYMATLKSWFYLFKMLVEFLTKYTACFLFAILELQPYRCLPFTPLFCLLYFCFDILRLTNTKLNWDLAIIFLNITTHSVAYTPLYEL
jgi:hypothetical protein